MPSFFFATRRFLFALLFVFSSTTTTPIVTCFQPVESSVVNNNLLESSVNKMCKDTTNESSVLRELKEKIEAQTKEIEALKHQLKGGGSGDKKAATSHGGAHGGGGPDMGADEYMESPFYKIASHRVGWLSLFLCSLSLTALIMNGFENTLHRQLELAYFVP